MAQTQYQNIDKGCEGILPQSKARKGSSNLQNRKTNFLKKVSEKSTRKRIEV